MYCTQCGVQGHGRFCGSCGAPLEALDCGACGREIAAGTRFCTHCGRPAGAGTGGRRPEQHRGPDASDGAQRSVWWVSGGLVAILTILVVASELPRSGGSGGTVPGGTSASGAAAVDLSSMTPRQAADNLFNRVMGAFASADTAQATAFLPMALAAYALARPLDADGLFHLSVLQREDRDYQGALSTALEGLRENPDHLLNLAAAAEAALRAGDREVAGGYYSRIRESWERERVAGRPEYQEHSSLLPLIREDAERFLEDDTP